VGCPQGKKEIGPFTLCQGGTGGEDVRRRLREKRRGRDRRETQIGIMTLKKLTIEGGERGKLSATEDDFLNRIYLHSMVEKMRQL